ncbi:small ubiquitin-related modifier 1 [Tetranychus urticae]|uniref:Ubiquitin-like domain-containing protein n=1 Tax=Tetranychus urticae TaxID=32264 RepID=T1KGF4_TETUR|nr:small ubiquitin-related modifier 1 [Tetranychus urticae]
MVEYDSPLWKNLDEFYKTLNVSKKSHELVITLNDKVLSMKDSPKKLNLTIVDILECYAKERSDGPEDARRKKHKEPKDPNVLEIKFRNNEDGKHAVPVTLRINKTSSMSLIMEEYAKTKGYSISDLIFDFDGDRLSGKETPFELEIEDGSLIDVIVKKPK